MYLGYHTCLRIEMMVAWERVNFRDIQRCIWGDWNVTVLEREDLETDTLQGHSWDQFLPSNGGLPTQNFSGFQRVT